MKMEYTLLNPLFPDASQKLTKQQVLPLDIATYTDDSTPPKVITILGRNATVFKFKVLWQ